MSEKGKRLITPAMEQKAEKAIESVMKYHSLRLAVVEFFNSYRYTPKELEGTDKTKKLAQSANIHFENGTWILKEGE